MQFSVIIPTMQAVAHSPSTVRQADKLALLGSGRIAATDTLERSTER